MQVKSKFTINQANLGIYSEVPGQFFVVHIGFVELLHAPDVARAEAIDVGFFLLDIVG